jgi:ABC transporter related protein
MKEILKLENLSKKYQAKNGETNAVNNVSFGINEGEFVSIIGPSGCGKSTILSMIAGLEEKTSGKIYIEGKEVIGTCNEVGYMLQKDSLLEWRTIYDNVMIGLEIRHIKTKENEEYTKQLLKKYHLDEFKDKYPGQLSGGMRQRVALIRTLAVKPKLLLLDEAFSALDYQTRLMVTKDVYEILKKEHKTALIVTHDISEAIAMSDRIIVLSNRPAYVKRIKKIDFEIPNRDPLNCRESSKFSKYFDLLWKELEIKDEQKE